MPEATQITYSHRELVEILVKQQGLHEGIWGLYVRFGLGAANVGDSPTQIQPAAIVPVLEIGLQKFDKEGSISVDAAKINPKPQTTVMLKQ
jgi:hypothetical protein